MTGVQTCALPILVNISKGSSVDLTKHMARVAMVFDFSGSMGTKFRDGSVQVSLWVVQSMHLY